MGDERVPAVDVATTCECVCVWCTNTTPQWLRSHCYGRFCWNAPSDEDSPEGVLDSPEVLGSDPPAAGVVAGVGVAVDEAVVPEDRPATCLCICTVCAMTKAGRGSGHCNGRYCPFARHLQEPSVLGGGGGTGGVVPPVTFGGGPVDEITEG